MEPAELIGVNRDGVCYIWRDLHAFFVRKDFKYEPWHNNGRGIVESFCREKTVGRIIVETELVKW